MPELPEVETIARDLRRLIVGARVSGVSSNWPRTLRSHDPETFSAVLVGRQIESVGRRGKQLLIALGSSHRDPAPAVLTVHLKMTGQLFVVPAGTLGDRHVHLVLALDDGRELQFRDMRKFGRIGLYRRDPATGLPVAGEAAGVLASGDEPLSDGFTARRLAELLSRRWGRIKTLLMNQDFLAGVGNIYADEALWRSRIHPLRDAHMLRPADARRLHAALQSVLAEAVERRGSSVDDYTAPEGDGSMQEHLDVYQRAGQPCHRCGRQVRRIVVGGRSTHYCGWCQRLPAGQKPGVPAEPAPPVRRGPRWTEFSGEAALGRTREEEAAVADRQRRLAATRKSAATRRAAARSSGAHVAAPSAVPSAAPSAAPSGASSEGIA